MKQKLILGIFGIIVTFVACKAVKHYQFKELYGTANDLIHHTNGLAEKPFLKAHLKNGNVYIFDDKWQFDSIKQTIQGIGELYDFKREILNSGELSVHLDSVALFETNKKLKANSSARLHAITIMSSLDAVLGVICLTVPKACFGSCPTFYVQNENNDNVFSSDAESFSNAISPSLEYSDIDDLNYKTSANKMSLVMKNETLETHVIKRANLAIVPINEDQKAFISPDDKIFVVENELLLSSSQCSEGDCTKLLKENDKKERFSLADDVNLVSKEEIILNFNGDYKMANPGIYFSFRQTLMTTYCLYSAIGYMGNEVADIFTKIEMDPKANEDIKSIFYKTLGAIEVYVDVNGSWKYQGEIYETGPIAFNHELLPLLDGKNAKDFKIKLVMNKGLWRIDKVAIFDIKKEVKPIYVIPDSLLKNNITADLELNHLIKQNDCIISMPGDEWDIHYTLPRLDNNQNFKIFLDAKGYYIEWMRDSWLKDKDLFSLNYLMKDPIGWLNSETSNYKKYEAEMENAFWDSRWTKKNKPYRDL